MHPNLRFPPTLLPFLMVVLMALFVVACGSDENSASSSSDSRDAGAASETTPEPGTPEAAAERGTPSSFTLTPAITTCMTEAGFVADAAPPAGGIVSWTHPDGARLVVAASGDTTLQIASDIGTEAAPANVNATTVTTGPPALADAATGCLAAS